MRFLTLEEEQRLMDAARLQSWVLLPLMIRLAVVTGLRRGALLALCWRDLMVDTESPHVTVERTKNGDSHVSPITPDLVQEFKRMKRIRSNDDDLIFAGKHRDQPHDFRHGFNEACKLAGLEGVTFSYPAAHKLLTAGTGGRGYSRHCRTCRPPFAIHDAPL